MSLYNMIHGVQPLAGPLLGMLQLHPGDVGRFRDCYLAETETGLEIHVFTRNGGGNRKEELDEELRSHPEFIRDFDDDYDCTYATYAFHVPKDFEEEVKALVELNPMILMSQSLRDRMETALEKIKDQESPEGQAILEKMKPLMEQIFEKLK